MMNIHRFLRVNHRIKLEISRRQLSFLNSNKSCILSNQQRWTPQTSTRSMAFIQVESVKKFLSAIPFLGFNQTKFKAIAFGHFESLVDNIDYVDFFEELDLPDTFYSWFVVTELHLWMLSARAMAGANEGRIIRNSLVEALWSDVLQRVKKLDSKSSAFDIRPKIVELSEQLQAAYLAYDEGLLSDDVVLAGAIWRRFYQQSDVDMEYVEKLVKYIRRNMKALENMNNEEFYNPVNIKWGSINT